MRSLFVAVLFSALTLTSAVADRIVQSPSYRQEARWSRSHQFHEKMRIGCRRSVRRASCRQKAFGCSQR